MRVRAGNPTGPADAAAVEAALKTVHDPEFLSIFLILG